ncbi:MAG: WD40/YVTN/BNR-like repeat-containing protein [Acidithiobacillales bacterium]
MRRHRAIGFAVLALASALPLLGEETKIDSEAFSGLTARSIGPAAMGGRITAIEAVPGERLTVWVGTAAGGVWKSEDGGLTFKPVFDREPQSVGALAVDPSDPKSVWVGTGESAVRNSVSVGAGVFRTTDGGETWEKLGLEGTERIARVAISPKDGKTVFVCATGPLWNDSSERGVFRTVDGGKKWEKVLYVDAKTGCADLAMDPQDPRHLYAGLWQFRRTPWSFTSGGPGSGLWRSADGGSTWSKVTKGLPSGELGRIGLDVSPARPSVVYAVVESKNTAIYRSDDLGESWTETNSSANVQARPFYFARVIADPVDVDRVYKPGFFLTVSADGGKTFQSASGGLLGMSVHPDHHALWINPKNPRELLLGTDGGIYISPDRGGHWRFVTDLPISQYYHVSVDDAVPYNVYGGLQDNGTWYGPSTVPGGIYSRHWKVIGYGDGFWAFVDPTDPDIVYDEYQGGHLMRTRKSTGETKEIAPYPKAGEPKLRYNWNTPIHVSTAKPGVLYYGSQYLHRSKDGGESWERISPDLTTNNPAREKQEESGGLTIDNSTAENHCTIYAIADSPKNPSVIWVGTDDGNLQVTRDDGKSWTNVARNVPGLPAGTWVSSVEAGHFDEGTAYATFDGHMTGDMKPWVFRTTDFGKTWTPLATGDLEGFAHVVKEDLGSPRLLFVGTESGLFVSVDGGKAWARFTGGLPRTPVCDLVVHPRDGDLVIATHGRGLYIVDDLTPLRNLTPEVLDSTVTLLPSRPAVLTIPTGEQRFDGDGDFEGHALPEAAMIAYYQKKRHIFGDLFLEVVGADGRKISTIPGNVRRGLTRVDWPMRLKPPKVPPATSLVEQPYAFVGPRLPEGTYTVKLTKGKTVVTGEVKLVGDPRSKHSAADRKLQQETALKLYGMLARLTFEVDRILDLQKQAATGASKLPAGSAARKRLERFGAGLETIRATLVATRPGQLTGEEQIRERIGTLYGGVNGYEGRPTASQLDRMAAVEKELDAAVARLDAYLAKELAAASGALPKGSAPLTPLTREEWDRKQEKS